MGGVRVLAVLALLVAALLQISASRRVSAETGVLRFADSLDVTTLNPFLATSSNLSTLAELTMGHLVGYDAQSNLVPELATEIPTKRNGGVSADGRTLTYHLRRGVRWSDGAPFTADDVLFTAAVVRNPDNNTTASGNSAWQDIVSIAKRDPWTFVVRLRRPDVEVPATFLAAGGLTCILPKHAFASTAINRAPYNALPVGIGPFRYTAFRRGDAVEMNANPYWYGSRPKLHAIVYKIIPDYTTAINELQTGELDVLFGINGAYVDRARSLPAKRVARFLDFFVSGVFINVTAAPTDDPVVRRALRLATDRPGIFARVVRGNGALTESVIPRILPGYADLPTVPFDPGRAAALLEADGWKLGPGGIREKNGIPLTIDLALPSGYQPASQTVELLRENWKQAGIRLDAHAYQVGIFFARAADGGIVESGKFNGALFSTEVAEYSAAANAFSCAGIPPHGLNASRYCSPAVDAALERLLETDDAARRARLSHEVQQRIYDDVPTIVMYERAGFVAYDERLHGFHPNAHEDFYRAENLAL